MHESDEKKLLKVPVWPSKAMPTVVAKKRRAAGGVRTEVAIELVHKRHNAMHTCLGDLKCKKEWERSQSAIGDEAHSFVTKHVEAKVEACQEIQHEQKAPDALQRRTRTQETDMTSGFFKCSKLLKDRDTSHTKIELEGRGLSATGGWNPKTEEGLVARLKKDEGDNDFCLAEVADHLTRHLHCT